MVMDILEGQIEGSFEAIEESILVQIPEKPLPPKDFYQLNFDHRKKIEKYIEIKSMAAEKCTVNLINEFVSRIQVSEYDEHGNKRFMPLEDGPDVIRPRNDYIPIDKFDWIVFDKIFQNITYPPLEKKKMLCKL